MPLYTAPKRLFQALTTKKLLLVTAESLTGGMIGSEITRFAGSSAVYWGGMVVYSPESKTSLLGITSNIIAQYGVVSNEVVQAMALGALNCCPAHISIAVTGIASPLLQLNNDPKANIMPVGTVWIAVGIKNPSGELSVFSKQYLFSGGRRSVRKKTVYTACEQAVCYLDRF